MERIAIYPGSFDPVTVGHMDVIQRACALFDRVVVAVIHNPHKHCAFTMAERVDMLQRCCQALPQVTVNSFDGLTMDFARQQGACAVVRGLRTASDFESELTLAQINRRLAPEIDTVFLMGIPEHCIISSTSVKELAQYSDHLFGFVPPAIEEQVRARLRSPSMC